jgi:hypothetical protein
VKKRKPRVDLEVGFGIRLLKNNQFYRCRIIDLSEGGIKIKEMDPGLIDAIQEGDTLLFSTDLDFYGIKGKGEVKWLLKNSETAGICFLELDWKSKALLNGFLKIVV